MSALDALSRGASVWLIEDVHWAGGDLLAFLDHAGRAPSRHGRLVVATARPSLLETAPAWCEGQRIDLAPLPPTEASALVRALLGSALPDQLVAAVVERSDGTPLFIEELLRTWASVGTLVLRRWRLAPRRPAGIGRAAAHRAGHLRGAAGRPAAGRPAGCPSRGGRRPARAARRVSVARARRTPRQGWTPCTGARSWPARSTTRSPARATPTATRCCATPATPRLPVPNAPASTSPWRAGWRRRRVTGPTSSPRPWPSTTPARSRAFPPLAGGDLPDRATLMREAAAWYERAAEAALRLAAHRGRAAPVRRSIELTDAGSPLDLARRRLRLGEILAASADLDAGIGEMEAALEGFARRCRRNGRCRLRPGAGLHAADPLPGGRGSWRPPRSRACTASRRRPSPASGPCMRGPSAPRADPTASVPRRTLPWPMRRRPAIRCSSSMSSSTSMPPATRSVRPGETDWALLEEKALAVGRWHQVVVAGRIRAILQSDTDLAFAIAATGGDCRARIGAWADRAGRLGELLADRGAVGDGSLGRCARGRARGDRARRAVRLPAPRVPHLGHRSADRRRPRRRVRLPIIGNDGGRRRPTTSRPRRRRTRA